MMLAWRVFRITETCWLLGTCKNAMAVWVLSKVFLIGASPNLLGEGALRIVKTCWVLEAFQERRHHRTCWVRGPFVLPKPARFWRPFVQSPKVFLNGGIAEPAG